MEPRLWERKCSFWKIAATIPMLRKGLCLHLIFLKCNTPTVLMCTLSKENHCTIEELWRHSWIIKKSCFWNLWKYFRETIQQIGRARGLEIRGHTAVLMQLFLHHQSVWPHLITYKSSLKVWQLIKISCLTW